MPHLVTLINKYLPAVGPKKRFTRYAACASALYSSSDCDGSSTHSV